MDDQSFQVKRPSTPQAVSLSVMTSQPSTPSFLLRNVKGQNLPKQENHIRRKIIFHKNTYALEHFYSPFPLLGVYPLRLAF